MSEAEFDLLLETVSSEISTDPQGDFFSESNFHRAIPAAANDNGEEWPMIPFPDGWTASC